MIARSVGLGILRNDRPAASALGFSDYDYNKYQPKIELINHSTGEISGYDPSVDNRNRKYIRQTAARKILGREHRTGWCMCRVRDNEQPTVLINGESGQAHYAGLMSCGNVWSCPVCAAKISQRRRDELSTVLDQHRADGGSLLLVTYTFPHTIQDDLSKMMKNLKRAWDAVKASREYKSIRSAYGLIGTIRTLEITHGVNGWHPHYHEIWFLKPDRQYISYDLRPIADPMLITAIRSRIYEIWKKQCVKKGLGKPSLSHGIDVRDGTYAKKYVSKWGLEDELTKSNLKNGRKSGLHPFQLLDDYIDGNKQSGALYAEYVTVFKNCRQLCWSRGLKKSFDLDDKTDEEIAAEIETNSTILGQIDLSDWHRILKHCRSRRDCRAELLAHAELGGWYAVQEFLVALKLPQYVDKPLERSTVPNPG